MEDFNALASALAAGVVDVRGCLILSRDGLVLGTFPSGEEAQIKPAWLRFATMGDPERGFAQFGAETWCYVRRGPYAAFAVVGPIPRPGLVIDHIEQVLLAAEQARGKLPGVGAEPTPTPALPPARPRTPLHAERPPSGQIVIAIDQEGPDAPVGDPTPCGPDPSEAAAAGGEHADEPLGRTGSDVRARGPEEAVPGQTPVDAKSASAWSRDGDEVGEDAGGPDAVDGADDVGEEVDRFSLSREFGRLLQDEERGADGFPDGDRRM